MDSEEVEAVGNLLGEMETGGSSGSAAIDLTMEQISSAVIHWDIYSEGDDAVDNEAGDDNDSTPLAHLELAEAVMRVLAEAGIRGARLVLQEDEAPEMLTQVLSELRVTASFEVRGFLLDRIYKEIRIAELSDKLRRRSTANHSRPSLGRSESVGCRECGEVHHFRPGNGESPSSQRLSGEISDGRAATNG